MLVSHPGGRVSFLGRVESCVAHGSGAGAAFGLGRGSAFAG